MLPAHQRLGPAHPPGRDLQLGLAIQQQLVALDRTAQLTHQRQALRALAIEPALEQRDRVARRAGLVERDAGPSHERVGLAAVPGKEADADARSCVEQQAGQLDRLVEHREDALRELARPLRAAARQDHGELAFGQARHRARVADSARQPRRDLAHQRVDLGIAH